MIRLALITIASIIINCGTTVSWGYYKVVDMNPSNVSDKDIFVSGRHCPFFSSPPHPLMNLAIIDALKHAPGKKGLKNAKFTDEFYFFTRCISVTGYATSAD